MNILIIADSLAIGGGAERVTTILGNELHRKGNEIHYLTFFDESPKYEFKGEYYTINQNKGKRNTLKKTVEFIKNGLKIKGICRKKGIDTVISVGEVANYHAVLSSILGNKSNIIISQHINPGIHLKDNFTVKMIKFFYQRASKTVCVSKDIEKILRNDFGIENTVTIYNMLDITKNISISKEDLPANFKELFNDGYKFINVGRLDEQKGQWFLIRSFRKVVDKHVDAKLFLLGDGDLKYELQNLIKNLNLENNVFLLGNQDNIFPFLRNSDCFVFSSLWEGFPMTLIEALSINLPVVSADCKTGPREILSPELELDEQVTYPYFGKYGILSRPFSRKFIFDDNEGISLGESELMLADLMIKMIEDPEIVKRYSNGIGFAEKLDKRQVIKEWEKILNF